MFENHDCIINIHIDITCFVKNTHNLYIVLNNNTGTLPNNKLT